MIDNLQRLGRIALDTYQMWLPVVVFLAARYSEKANKVLNYIFDINTAVLTATDAILKEFENLKHIQNINDFTREIEEILGRQLNKKEIIDMQKEIEKEGVSIDWQDGIGRLNFNKKF